MLRHVKTFSKHYDDDLKRTKLAWTLALGTNCAGKKAKVEDENVSSAEVFND